MLWFRLTFHAVRDQSSKKPHCSYRCTFALFGSTFSLPYGFFYLFLFTQKHAVLSSIRKDTHLHNHIFTGSYQATICTSFYSNRNSCKLLVLTENSKAEQILQYSRAVMYIKTFHLYSTKSPSSSASRTDSHKNLDQHTLHRHLVTKEPTTVSTTDIVYSYN